MKERLRLPVDVDPLSDARWNRIERETFAKLDGAPRTRPFDWTGTVSRWPALAWGGALVAVGLAVTLVFVWPWSGGPASNRSRLVTSDSASQFTVGESSLTVAPRSLVMVSGDDERGIEVILDHGGVTCEVAPRRGRPPFIVNAGEVRVRVTGTRFAVGREEGVVSVRVDHGTVDVSERGVVTTLRDGEGWPVGTTASQDSVSHASELSPGNAAGASPSSLLPAAPAASSRAALAVHPHAGDAPSMTSGSLPPSPDHADEGRTASSSPSASTPTSMTRPTPQDVFESAARMERTRPDQASAIYRQLVAGNTAWSPNALFALSRLEMDRGHRDEAVRLLDSYLAQYPHGINAKDARDLLSRLR